MRLPVSKKVCIISLNQNLGTWPQVLTNWTGKYGEKCSEEREGMSDENLCLLQKTSDYKYRSYNPMRLLYHSDFCCANKIPKKINLFIYWYRGQNLRPCLCQAGAYATQLNTQPQKIDLEEERCILTHGFRGFSLWLLGSIVSGLVVRQSNHHEESVAGQSCLCFHNQ